MFLRDTLRITFLDFQRKKLRTVLTISAVAIGVSFTTLIISASTGVKTFFIDQYHVFIAPETLMVMKSQRHRGHPFVDMGSIPREVRDDGGETGLEKVWNNLFRKKDIEELDKIAHIERVDPMFYVPVETIQLADGEKRFEVFASILLPYEMKLRKLMAGRYLKEGEKGRALIAFPYLEAFGLKAPEEALGKEIIISVQDSYNFFGDFSNAPRVKSYRFQIVGVTEKTLASTEVILSPKDGRNIFKFRNTGLLSFLIDKSPGFMVKVKLSDKRYLSQVKEGIKEMGYRVISPEEILGSFGKVYFIIQAVMVIFGLVSLAVAVMGAINILLMIVHERTKDIGIMKAIGANDKAVAGIFILEGLLIGLLGGIIGLIAALLIGKTLNYVGSYTFLKNYVSFDIFIYPIWLWVGMILLTVLLCGLTSIYPALKASKLSPVESLRYE
jgi:putative ABC transport system permease protein